MSSSWVNRDLGVWCRRSVRRRRSGFLRRSTPRRRRNSTRSQFLKDSRWVGDEASRRSNRRSWWRLRSPFCRRSPVFRRRSLALQSIRSGVIRGEWRGCQRGPTPVPVQRKPKGVGVEPVRRRRKGVDFPHRFRGDRRFMFLNPKIFFSLFITPSVIFSSFLSRSGLCSQILVTP